MYNSLRGAFFSFSKQRKIKNTNTKIPQYPTWQFFVTFFGWLRDPFQWLSDLQLGDEKVTLNHLEEVIIFFLKSSLSKGRSLGRSTT